MKRIGTIPGIIGLCTTLAVPLVVVACVRPRARRRNKQGAGQRRRSARWQWAAS